jgi:gas vesicle protein
MEGISMNKFLSFLAGAMCGAVVGATAALLLTPASGEQLRSDVATRWAEALEEARRAMEETRLELQAQFEQMQAADYQMPEQQE